MPYLAWVVIWVGTSWYGVPALAGVGGKPAKAGTPYQETAARNLKMTTDEMFI